MGLGDELRYRSLISIRRWRWNEVCKFSTRLLDKQVVTSSNNQIILRVISAFHGLKTSPRGSFDRFLLRELNGLEIPPQNTLDTHINFDIHSDISNILVHLLANTDIKIGTYDSGCVSSVLNENKLFLDVIRSLPIYIPLELSSNPYDICNLDEENTVTRSSSNCGYTQHIQLYVFAVGLLTLTRAAALINLNALKKIIQTVYYFTVQQNLFPQDWLRRQLELNYACILSDYPSQVIKSEDNINNSDDSSNGMKVYKELLIETCKPLITVVYHDLFARNWYLLTEKVELNKNISVKYEIFYQTTDNNVYIGLSGCDLTHVMNIRTFVDLYNRFISNIAIEICDCTFKLSEEQSCDFISKMAILNPIFIGCNIEMLHKFIGNLWIMLTRYETITEPCSKNFQSSIPHSVSEFAKKMLGCDLECFSSPLNTQSQCFCSLFPQTDAMFGSKGNFFDYVNDGLLDNHTAIIVNPPFELYILEKTVDVILQVIHNSFSY